MRSIRFALAVALILAAAGSGRAQTAASMSPLEVAVACAPPPTLDTPTGKLLRVIGAQDVAARTEFGSGDLLMINGGTAAGVALGQQYFVRRANRFGTPGTSAHQGARTGGWIKIVAVNESTAIASFDHVCGPVAANDYLEPFVAPVVPPGADRDEAPGEPDFNAMGQIVVGTEDHSTMATGDFALVDRGSQHGLAPGSRVALFRSVGVSGMPLTAVGEAIVISVSPTMALTRITRTKDAIRGGDFVAPRK